MHLIMQTEGLHTFPLLSLITYGMSTKHAGHKMKGEQKRESGIYSNNCLSHVYYCICFFLGSKNMKPSFYCMIKVVSLPSLSFCTCFPYYKNSKKSSPKSSISFSAGTVVSTFSLFWYWSFYQISKSSSRDNAN